MERRRRRWNYMQSRRRSSSTAPLLSSLSSSMSLPSSSLAVSSDAQRHEVDDFIDYSNKNGPDARLQQNQGDDLSSQTLRQREYRAR